MELSSVILVFLNFLFIGALPTVFFKKGKLTTMWFVTAFPFALPPLFIVLLYLGMLPTFIAFSSYAYQWMMIVGIGLSVASIGLIFLTLGAHRIPLALWHQHHQDDAPIEIVRWGSYKYVRHPFYASFILAAIANVFVTPFWGNIIVLLYIALILNFTAGKEENRLRRDAKLGDQYQEYMRSTGRFFPGM